MTEVSNKKYKQMKRFEIISNPTEFEATQVKSSDDVFKVVYKFFENDVEIFESFFILLLNRANTTIGFAKISQGGTCGTVVDIKILVKYALDTLATGVVLCHNHPSGNLKPSEQDIKLTKQIKEGLAIFDIEVMDHLILTKNTYFSFLDEGVL